LTLLVLHCVNLSKGLGFTRVLRFLLGRVLALHVDVSVEDSVESLVASTVEAFGGLDFAVNNAGIESLRACVADADFSNYQRVMVSPLMPLALGRGWHLLACSFVQGSKWCAV
jgi:NAD(P)-dependent dehydrogenase (short-subunit alcohol dehydrogenase family)